LNLTSSLVIFIESKSQFRRASELYTVRLILRVLRASLSSDDDFGEHSVGRVRAWRGVAVSWNLDRLPYFIPSPATTVNWNSRLSGELSWRYATGSVQDTTCRKLIPWDDYVRYPGSRWASGKGEMEVQDILVCHRSSWKDFMSNPTAFQAASL